MKASVGDRIVILRHDEHAILRDGEIVQVPNADGSPPYYVRWSDSGHNTLIFPGPDARVTHYAHDGKIDESSETP
jgi:uncharacterized protein DUF1918